MGRSRQAGGGLERAAPVVRGRLVEELDLAVSGLPEEAAGALAALVADSVPTATSMIHSVEGARLRLVAGHGLPRQWERLRGVPAKDTLGAAVVDSKLPLIITDVDVDRRVPADAPIRAVGGRAYAGFPIRDVDGEVVGVLCALDYQPRQWQARELAAVDRCAQVATALMSERQAAVEADRQRRFLDVLLDRLPVAVAACDADAGIVFANEPMRRGFAPRIADATDSVRSWGAELTLRDSAGRDLQVEQLPLLRALRGEEVGEAEVAAVRPGRPTAVWATNAGRIQDAAGQLLGAVVCAQDITARHRARRIHDSELRLAKVLASDEITVAHAGAQFLKEVADTLRWPHAEMWLVDDQAGVLRPGARYDALSRDGDLALPPQLRPGQGLAGKAWESHNAVWIHDLAVAGHIDAARSGLRTALALPVPNSQEHVLAVIALFADVLEEPEEILTTLVTGMAGHLGQFLERRRSNELQLNLLRTKDEYIALIGHEMRTPLTSIGSYTELLRDLVDDPQARELVDVVDRNTTQLRHIIDELLDLAALDTGHATIACRPVDLAALVRDAVDNLDPHLRRPGLTITTRLDDDCAIKGDPDRLRQVVDTLLNNAVTYSPDGGSVTVTLRRSGDTLVELTVTDEGIGIPPDERDQLFSRFYRSSVTRDRRIPGVGLALATSRAILDRHRASIRLHPTDIGTCIEVRIPVEC